MRLLDVDLTTQSVREVKLGESLVDRYAVPHLAVYKLAQLKLAEPGDVLLVRSAVSKLDVCSRSTVFICRLGIDRVECVPLLSKNLGALMGSARVDFVKLRGEGEGTLLLDRCELLPEVAIPQLRIDKGEIDTEIAVHRADIDVKVELSLAAEELVEPQDTLIARRLRLLMCLSPLTGEGRPVHREGIIVLIKKLIGLELSERARDLVSKYSTERLGCLRCKTCCLNIDVDRKLHVEPSRVTLLDAMIDEEMRLALSRTGLDSYFMILALYMWRFRYPEPVPSIEYLVERLSMLYKVVRLLGLCPLHLVHSSMSRRFDLDIPRDLFSVVTGRRVSSYILSEIARLVAGEESGLAMSIESCERATRLIESLPTGTIESHPVLESLRTPTIQAALDLVDDLERVQNIAHICASCGVGIIEAGTPLLKKYGTDAVIKLRQAAASHGALVLADTKTMDVGDLEARISYLAGADICTVMGVGESAKISESLYEAVKFNKAVMIDLMQVPDPVRYIEELRELLESCGDWVIVCLHRGITEQLLGRGISSDVDLIRAVRRILTPSVKLAVAGGVKPGEVRKLVEAGADIVVVGAALYAARDVERTARQLVEEARASQC